MSVRHRAGPDYAVSEMEIVDTFTKLIFGGEAHYTDLESLIIQGLRTADPYLTLDNHTDMGRYLRALGVKEMVKLVSQVRLEMALGHTLRPAPVGPDVRSPRPPAI
jgi:hypothetical protein